MPELTEVFEFPHQVQADEIDELGHAGNFHYVRWMQHAAVAHSTVNGWPTQRYQDLGCGWVVRSHQITYRKPAFEGDALIISTWVTNMRRATSLRRYEIRNQNSGLLATAETDWAFINYTKQSPVRIPPAVAQCFVVLGN